MKDDNGDPQNNINGKLKGLFFSCNVDKNTGMPFTKSVFGSRRFLVPARHLVCSPGTRLYFADFYCVSVSKLHWVTLVMTEVGSSADMFCQRKLVELKKTENNFLYISRSGDVFVTTGAWIELLYTEDIDLNFWITNYHCSFKSTIAKGNRHGGKRKRLFCSVCNLDVQRNILFLLRNLLRD